jgi:hypothetical protein
MARITRGKLWTSILGVFILAAALVAGYNHHVQIGKASLVAKGKVSLDKAKNMVGSMPLAFEPNQGQTDSRVQFFARSAGYQVFLTSGSSATMEFKGAGDKVNVVTMNLAGAKDTAKAQPEDKLRGISNYYIGSDQSKWIAGIPHYGQVRYNDLYPGVAVVYQGDNLRFRYDFEVAPGADPNAIHWSYDGANNVSVNPEGALVVSTQDGEQVASSKPYIYQEYGSEKRQVTGGYRLNGKDVSFEIASYDSKRPLVIDPSLSNGTLIGATGTQTGDTVLNAVANNATDIYVTGYTLSANFPTKNPAQAIPGSLNEVVVSEFDYTMNAANNPIFSTFLGGNGIDLGNAIALDSAGDAIVVGTTQSGANFPSKNPLLAAAPPNRENAFVVKLNAAGALLNASQIWGTGATVGNGVAVQASTGNIAITGSSTSNDLMTVIGAPGTSFQAVNNSTLPGPNEIVIDLSDSSTSTLAVLYASYFGGTNSDIGNAVAFDPTTGDIVVAGSSTSFNGTTASSVLQTAAASPHTALEITSAGTHGILTKFNPTPASAATSLVFSQAIGKQGGSGFESLTAVAVDVNGNNYIAGNLTETNPATEHVFTSPAATLDGTGTAGGTAQDGFVIEIGPSGGGSLVYGTLVTGDEVAGNNGGTTANAQTNVTGIAVDSLGQAYISGFVNNCVAPATCTTPTGYAIRRRINEGGFIVAGTPFLTDFVTAQPTQTGAVTAVGDIVLTDGTTTAASPFGATNGVSIDPSGLGGACVAGYINQKTLPTAGTAPILQSSAFEPTGPAAGIKTGLIVCNLYNSDTTITSSTTSTSPGTFVFTQVDGSNTSSPTSQTFTAVNNDPNVTASDFTISPVDGSGQITAAQYSPTTSNSLRWLSIAKSGATVTMTINTTIAGTFDPGLYSVTFLVTPLQGDNTGVPQTVTVQLSITGTLDEDTVFGGGTLLSTESGTGATNLPSYGSAVTCVDATLTCTMSITEGQTTFSDGNSTETFTIPLVSIVQHFNPSAGNIEFNETEANGAGSLDFITFNDTSTGPNGAAGCNGRATANACVVTVNINASTFVHLQSQSYTDTLQVNITGTTPNPPRGVIGGATESTSQVPDPKAITFIVNVSKGSLIFGGGSTTFSAPAGAGPFVLQQKNTYLDSISLGTTTVTTFSTTVTPASTANPVTCGGGISATAPFPAGVLTLNLSGPLQASSNTTVLNPGFTATQTPEAIIVANTTTINAGSYGEYVTFTPSSGAAFATNPVPICLIVGNVLTTTLESQEELNITTGTAGAANGGDTVPFDVEAGASWCVTVTASCPASDFGSLADVRVTAVGSLTPIVGPPSSLASGVPVTVSILSGPSWVTLAGVNTNGSSPWPLPLVDQINVQPPLTTLAGHYPVVFQVVATAAANTINSALPTPETVTLDINVSNGIGVFYWDSEFTDGFGNDIIVASPTTPGAPASEAPGPVPPSNPNTVCTAPAGNTINLCFYTIVGSGIVTDGNGNPTGTITLMGDEANEASNGRAVLSNTGLNYTYPFGLHFIGATRPDTQFGCFLRIDPTHSCTLTVDSFDTNIVAQSPVGAFEADFTINLRNDALSLLPVPTPEMVRVILNVQNFPTVTVTPGSLTYSITQAGLAPPVRTLTLTATSIPVASGIPFTATPAGSEVVLYENGTAVPSIAGLLLAGNAEVDAVTGNPITITVGINPSGLTQLGSPYTGDIAFTFGTCSPGQPASCVAVNVADPLPPVVPIVVNVSTTPGLSICGNLGGATANNCATYNWTVGDPASAPNTPTTVAITLIGNDTYNVTSSQPWAVVSAPSPNNAAAQSTVSVSLNLAAAPTTPGTYTANITVTGITGTEVPAVTTITLIVAGPPAFTVGAGTGTMGTVASPGTPGTDGQTVTYNYGSPNPSPLNIAESVTNTPDNPTLPVTYSAITYSSGATGWLTLTTSPATINNSGATLVASINPTTPTIAPGTYTATFTATATDGNVPATYTASVTYTVTLNVVGSLTATAANSLFTYVIGTSSNDLPLVITSQPAGVTFNISTTANLAASIMTGSTPNTPQITVNGTTLLTAGSTAGMFNESLGVLTGNITVSVLNSLLNCPAAQVTGTLCTVTVPFTLNVHPSFFQGETSIGGGFYTLPNFGTYAYFPSQTAIYHTTLGIESFFSITDANRGLYMTDQATQQIWYTSPTLFPYIYDFGTVAAPLNEWIQYSGVGSGTAGTRVFTNTFTLNTTTGMYVYTGSQTK